MTVRSFESVMNDIKLFYDIAYSGYEQWKNKYRLMQGDRDRLRKAIVASGMVEANCMMCGCDVVAIPDGLYMCEECAVKEDARSGI